MAVTTFKYASQSDLKNYFNNFGDYDQKTQIFNWVFDSGSFGAIGTDDDYDFYSASNTGNITQLYFDGNEASTGPLTLDNSCALTNDNNFGMEDSSFVSDAGHGLAQGDIIKIGNEYMLVTVVETNTITVSRGHFSTSATDHADDSNIYKFYDSDTMHDNRSQGVTPFYYFYDSELDICILCVDGGDNTSAGSRENNPNEHIIEAGIDFNTFANQQLVNASLELNNLLDARFATPIPKSTQISDSAASGITPEWDPVIIKSTCYLAAANLIRSKDPMSEEAQFYMNMVTNNDGTGLVDKINTGHIKLSFETDNKDSKGSIRQITRSGSMYLIETSGEFSAGHNGYDLLRITCTTGGAYGVAKCKVEYYGSDKLFGQNTTNNIVTGGLDGWSGLGGLGVRFQGSSMTTNDQWEIEVYNEDKTETNTVVRNIQLIR